MIIGQLRVEWWEFLLWVTGLVAFLQCRLDPLPSIVVKGSGVFTAVM